MLKDRSTFLLDIFVQSNIVVLNQSIVDTFKAPDVSMGSFDGMRSWIRLQGRTLEIVESISHQCIIHNFSLGAGSSV